ncbi:hypothetical protein MSSAC_2772 [Methanosarcina siciliae C2J]|uniref:Uncharacterized protein n=1 Tax=Methanosarcina siciliae C2J TaxID=1434118 RepID=A0A0E3PQ34_9EURY|nr:hypothetical protein [Methanosarcina siciliae]AKB37362.1 hypothetical protein MSSAC_2772 [Methanosarcina siciliae C2J]
MDYSSYIQSASLFVSGVLVPLLYSVLKEYKSNAELTNQLKKYASNLSLLEIVTIMSAVADWIKDGCPDEGGQEVLKKIREAVSS